ncbi:MAG: hypothetical protein ACR2MT_11985, partial [Aurantibacter sp.]
FTFQPSQSNLLFRRIPSFASNTHQTGGINFNDQISSVRFKNVYFAFYADHNYGGRTFVIDSRGFEGFISNFRRLRLNSFDFHAASNTVTGGNSHCGCCCTSWNDKATSIAINGNMGTNLP